MLRWRNLRDVVSLLVLMRRTLLAEFAVAAVPEVWSGMNGIVYLGTEF